MYGELLLVLTEASVLNDAEESLITETLLFHGTNVAIRSPDLIILDELL